jgi:DNA polymerase-3 subunit alpha
VTKSETAKVAFYVADARSMGIDVLPPDVNNSLWDFSIEDFPDGKSAIRFGLGAVKNVGEAPVNLILEARKTGKFHDLNDFLRRVDLHKVGKRSLECLIKVGALDGFGPRRSILEVVDTMLSISNSHFRASECGQLSIFGSVAGVEEDIRLPADTGLDHRLQLEWEKELIGLYVSDHPISPYLPVIRERVTHFSKDLAEAAQKQKVTVAGLVTYIRTTMTKKTNKMMAFATIEDLQGAIELVIFPNVWEKFGALVRMESVIIVDGQVDAEATEPKVLVDVIKPLNEQDIQSFQPSKPGTDDPAAPDSAIWQTDIDTARYMQYENGYEEPPLSPEEAAWTPAPASSIPEDTSADVQPVETPVKEEEPADNPTIMAQHSEPVEEI